MQDPPGFARRTVRYGREAERSLNWPTPGRRRSCPETRIRVRSIHGLGSIGNCALKAAAIPDLRALGRANLAYLSHHTPHLSWVKCCDDQLNPRSKSDWQVRTAQGGKRTPEVHTEEMVRLSDPYLLLAVDLINMADPDEAGTGMRIADDLMKARFFSDESALPICLQRLNGLLANPDVCSGELKGLLNRASAKTWGVQYERVSPRQFLEALRTALEEYIRRQPPGGRARDGKA